MEHALSRMVMGWNVDKERSEELFRTQYVSLLKRQWVDMLSKGQVL